MCAVPATGFIRFDDAYHYTPGQPRRYNPRNQQVNREAALDRGSRRMSTHYHMPSRSFPKGVRQGSKHTRPSSRCQFTVPFSTDEATGHRHSESCQQGWQRTNSQSSSLPVPHPGKQGKQFAHRAGTCGANSGHSTAPPGSAACCTVRAFCSLFRCTLTLFSRHYPVRVCSFGGCGEWGAGGVAQHCLALSSPLNSPVQSSGPPPPTLHQSTTACAGDGVFKPPIHIRA